ncbi:serine/threonine-protein kinase TOUSLED-like [Hibiscus syriacus]|uniref:serine/threonine-protein kinase TOUSLED-like n=1 Tax=Hibiscus syriacus TaxID=106335 RepID=UPI001921418F|nr:serine/threonine-protein kinase TOUSLED-like [Hibiscus syriacus]
MSDDVLLHFSSNSSNQSDHSLPTKIAKLEARLVGKASSSIASQQPSQTQQQQQQLPWPPLSSASKFFSTENLSEASGSSDSDGEWR